MNKYAQSAVEEDEDDVDPGNSFIDCTTQAQVLEAMGCSGCKACIYWKPQGQWSQNGFKTENLLLLMMALQVPVRN